MPKWITANIGLKILSIFIAAVVWFHVITEKNYEQVFSIPLTYKNLNESLIFGEDPPESLKIAIRGTGKELLLFRLGRGLTAMYDLTGFERGWKRIEFNETNVNLPPGSKAELKGIIDPKSTVLHLEEKVEKVLRVVPNIKGNIEYAVNPRSIAVTGRRTTLQRLSTIKTEEIEAESLTTPETLKVKLSIPEGVISDTDSVMVILKSSG
jgi:YbbR domain-containing protein